MITGKVAICYTDETEFTDIQGIGNDPIYKRFPSVYAIVEQHIDEQYRSFLAEPEYRCESILKNTVEHYRSVTDNLSGENQNIMRAALKFINEDYVYLIGDYVVLTVWGMTPDKYIHESAGTVVHQLDIPVSFLITFDGGEHGKLENPNENCLRRLNGHVMTKLDFPNIKADVGYTFAGWSPNGNGYTVRGNVTFTAQYEVEPVVTPIVDEPPVVDEPPIVDEPPVEDPLTTQSINDEPIEKQMYHVRFVGTDGCSLFGETELDVEEGTVLAEDQIPQVITDENYSFKGWTPSVSSAIEHDITFNAVCEKSEKLVNVCFDAGNHGTIVGDSMFTVPAGTSLAPKLIPSVTPNKDYNFVGWDIDPLNSVFNDDITITACYEKKESWWKRLWFWLFSGGCLKRLLWFLLLLLAFLFLISCLHQCRGCSQAIGADDETNGPAVIDSLDNRFDGNPGNADNGRIGHVPSTPIDQPDLGEGVEPGNGDADYHAGVFRPNPDVPPVDNPDEPNGPQIVPNVINVFFKNDNANLNAFAKDFRSFYPDTQKYLLDYDDYVKRVSIMMPAAERLEVKRNVEQNLGRKYAFIIVDETAIEQSNNISANSVGNGGNMNNAGWHLKAVHAPQAWKITPGNPNVVVAVVDDGCDVNHCMFKDKVVAPYNVFSKTSTLTYGSGHGTHTAGLAAGLILDNGKAAGIAPGCKLMPVEVFIGGKSTLSAEVSGIAYAIHKGADVVNISMGGNYSRYKGLPEHEQENIARQKNKIEEVLWQRVFDMAKAKNVILVFSAGNDDVVSFVNPQNRPDSIISVTAVTPQLEKASFTDYGVGSTIASPGVEIFSTMPPNTFGMMQGTSQAAPIVAGTVALLKSVKKNLTAIEAINILKKSGKTLSNTKLGPFVQADRALLLLKTGRLPAAEQDNSGNEGNADYSDILRQIREHRQAIGSLIRQLPPEERSKIENNKKKNI